MNLAVAAEKWEAETGGTVWTEKDAVGLESHRVGPIAAEQLLGAAADRTYS